MFDRRQFLGGLALPAASLGLSAGVCSAATALARAESASTEDEYWFEIARAFTTDRSLTNLNNGGVSPSPGYVQAAMKAHLDYANTAPAYVLWRVQEPRKETVRRRIARAWGVDSEEIALTRNASEGLQICQFGIELKRGDEVLTTDQDYPRMITTFKQRERREGIVLRQFSIPTPSENPDEIVRLFEQNITPKTRLILVSHMVFMTGQILPVAEVVALGRRHDIPVIIDGAHSFAHFDFKLSDLDCDYYATSLHKWLFSPHGTGLLYVRKNKIRDLWPLQAAAESLDDDIRKFEEIGTHPIANTLAIAEALTFHEGIGAHRKQERLVHLRDYWAKRLLENDRVHMNTSLEPGFACGIANVAIDGIDAKELVSWLWRARRILTVGIGHASCAGMRVSPSVYTTHDELDRFSEAVEFAMKHGV